MKTVIDGLRAAAKAWAKEALIGEVTPTHDEADLALEQALTESGLIGLLGDLAEEAFFCMMGEYAFVEVYFQSGFMLQIPTEAE